MVCSLASGLSRSAITGFPLLTAVDVNVHTFPYLLGLGSTRLRFVES